MSDFFGDDFTVELKRYFLDNLSKEVDKHVDLVDDSHWTRIRSEVCELSQSWSVDAKSNEFSHFAQWLADFSERVKDLQHASEFTKALLVIKSYCENLTSDSNDTAELAAKYSSVVESRHEVMFLQCKWGQQDFAIPLLKVVEITGGLSLYSMPDKKDGILGVIPFRGEAVPVVSFAELGFLEADSKNAFYVICEHESVRFSLQVTATEDLVSLRESELLNAEGAETMIPASFVSRFFVKNKKSIMILDVEKMVA
ncbi:MAG: chemotaxis protein CheW [Bdellovibrio sp.]|nr:chemotaxis protein CheW [Bdellovibrio sp.]